jgi:hypothetical protein
MVDVSMMVKGWDDWVWISWETTDSTAELLGRERRMWERGGRDWIESVSWTEE